MATNSETATATFCKSRCRISQNATEGVCNASQAAPNLQYASRMNCPARLFRSWIVKSFTQSGCGFTYLCCECALPALLQPVQPLPKLAKLRLQFISCFRRWIPCLRIVPKHVGIALLGIGNVPFGPFPVAHAVRSFGNVSERHAQAQIRPDEIQAYFFNIAGDVQPFLKQVTHDHILGDHGPRCFPARSWNAELASSGRNPNGAHRRQRSQTSFRRNPGVCLPFASTNNPRDAIIAANSVLM